MSLLEVRVVVICLFFGVLTETWTIIESTYEQLRDYRYYNPNTLRLRLVSYFTPVYSFAAPGTNSTCVYEIWTIEFQEVFSIENFIHIYNSRASSKNITFQVQARITKHNEHLHIHIDKQEAIKDKRHRQ